ncbi:unnamed protein product [Mucor hiemalis]
MTVNSSTATASFFTSFNSNKRRPSLGLPTSPLNRSFLQSPLWNTITTTTKPIDKSSKKKQGKQPQQQQQIQQAIYVLPKSPSNVSIYLQLPAFRSLSVMMRCGHVSRLVENWLCNPMDQLKRNAERAYQQQNKDKRITRKRSSSLCIMPANNEEIVPSKSTPLVRQTHTPVVNNSLVRYQKNTYQPLSSLFIHFQAGQQSQPMEIQYNHVPCLFTVVCVTYHCGSVSVSINQIESLDFLSSSSRMNPFLVKCDLHPNHPVTIHQLTSSYPLPQICDYAAATVEEVVEMSPLTVEAIENSTTFYPEQVTICRPEKDPSYFVESPEKPLKHSELIHMQELYGEEDDDDESCLYSSSEEFSVLDDLDTEEDEPTEENAAQAALLRLVQDTLEYIQSSRGAVSDELNQLEYKLYNYSRTHSSVYN